MFSPSRPRWRLSSSTSTPPSVTPFTASPTFLSGSNAWCVPAKSSLSPPSTTSSGCLSVSPLSSSTFSPCSPGSASCAYPSWPNRSSLAPSFADKNHHSYVVRGYPNSYISNDDLLALDGWGKEGGTWTESGVEEEGLGISWSTTRQPEVVTGEERRRRPGVAPMMAERRRQRSRSVKKKSIGKAAMSTIAE